MFRSWVSAFVILGILLTSSGLTYRQLEKQDWQGILSVFSAQILDTHSDLLKDSDLLPTPAVVLGSSVEILDAKKSIATVSSIVDGDTITLTTGQKVRYIGIDTPELHHPTKGKQCFGEEAKKRNSELVLGRTVVLEKDVNETDRYGRLLRYVWINDQLINKTLVAEGYAFAASFPPDIHRQTELRLAEQEARKQQLGLWQSCPSLQTSK